MLRTLYISLLMLAVGLTHSGYSQGIKYNPITKIKDSFHQHYIGTDSKKGQYILVSNWSMKKDYRESGYTNKLITFGSQKVKLVTYNSQFTFKAEYPIEFKHTLGVMYDAFIVDDEILMFYTSENSLTMLVDKFSLTGAYKETIELDKLVDAPSKTVDPGKTFSFITSDNHETICLVSKSQVKFFNNKLEALWAPEFNYESLTSMNITDDGKVLSLCISDKTLYLVKYNISGKHDENVPVTISTSVNDFNLAYKNGIAHVVCQYSTADIQRDGRFYANGLQVNGFDVEAMEEKYVHQIKYNDEALLGISYRKKLEKVQGLAFLKIRSVHSKADNSLIVVLRNHKIIQTTDISAEHNDYEDLYENILLVTVNDEGGHNQLMIEAESKGGSEYGNLLSLASFYKHEKLYLYYNEGRSPYKLTQTQISPSLSILKSTAVNTWKTAGVYYGIRDYQKINDNQYIVLGRWQKKIGSMVISFE